MGLRIVIVQDDLEYATKLESLLAQEDHQVNATFGSAFLFLESAKQAARRNHVEWDLVLMDLGMADRSGIEAARSLNEILPDMPLVLFSVFETPASIVRAIRPGLDGRLLKKTSTHRLLSHLRAITVSYPSAPHPGVPERFQVVGLRPSALELVSRIARGRRD
jgi:DNA-binding NarL/FixJ family response regulator